MAKEEGAPGTIFAQGRRRLFCSAGAEFLRPHLERLLDSKVLPPGTTEDAVRGLAQRMRFVLPEGVFFAKRYAETGFTRLRSLGRRSRAHREYDALLLLGAKIGNPIEALAWGERRICGINTASVIALREWPGAVDLRKLRGVFLGESAASGQTNDSVLRLRSGVCAAIPSFMQKLKLLHDHGIQLSDCYDKNVLYRSDLAPERALAWIDQPRLRSRTAPLSARARAFDLACLDKATRGGILTRRERLLAYASYVAADGREWPRSGCDAAASAMDKVARKLLRLVVRERKSRERAGWRRRIFRSRNLKRLFRRWTRTSKSTPITAPLAAPRSAIRPSTSATGTNGSRTGESGR